MRYAIVINLDYQTFYADDCRFVWSKIKQGMLDAGFIMDKRLFTIDTSEEDACELAREVIEGLDNRKLQGIDIFSYVLDFYGYDHSDSVNLLMPASDSFLVELC
ncbi:hypothetical protein MNBD_GAMMA12-550 [hydrothermal vent metagenome]|uniref:Uncharacterized protein n=1 Tax=hydrothermal vent metagenome TaxID=652676 RepID=A0A3B0XXT2_9ZZZZ